MPPAPVAPRCAAGSEVAVAWSIYPPARLAKLVAALAIELRELEATEALVASAGAGITSSLGHPDPGAPDAQPLADAVPAAAVA